VIIDERPPLVKKGENISLKINTVGINGYSKNITLSILEEIDDLDITFSDREILPPGTVTMDVKVLEDDGPYFITVVASSEGLTRTDSIRIDTQPPRKDIKISAPDDKVEFIDSGKGIKEAQFNIILTPVNGVFTDIILDLGDIPEGGEVLLSPSNLKRIPYELNVTVTITIPADISFMYFNLTLSSEEENSQWMISVPLMDTENGNEEDGNILAPVIVISLIVLLLLIGSIILLKDRISNILKPDENPQVNEGDMDIGKGRRSNSDNKTGQPPDHRHRNMDRLGSRFR
jgi:hypothetical protein